MEAKCQHQDLVCDDLELHHVGCQCILSSCILFQIDSKSDFDVTMFCADYVASFIHHGIIVGLWCEYNKRLETAKNIDTDSISSVKSVFAGCLAGNAMCSR